MRDQSGIKKYEKGTSSTYFEVWIKFLKYVEVVEIVEVSRSKEIIRKRVYTH